MKLHERYPLLLLALLALSLSFVTPSNVGTQSDADARETFESWVMKHGKVYGTPAEKENRFGIFKANILYIDEHNAKNGPYRLGLNRFADLTKEEFQSMYGGAHKTKGRKIAENSVSHRLNVKKSVNVSNPPKSVDWRKKGAVTSVKDQGNCAGASWAFGAIATMESLYFMKYRKSKTFSEQQVIDCAFAQYGGAGCGSGSSVNDAFQYIKDNGGISTDAEYPYTVIPGTCRQDVTKVFQINGYTNVLQGDEIELQKAVAQQPVSAMIYVDLNFQMYHSGIYEGPCLNNVGSQGLAIVGYGTENGVDYWILKNSWGINWGEAGYIRMRRNIGLCGIADRASYPQ